MIDERLHIEELLRRFMEGETTLNEEHFLGDWLRTHEVDDSLKPYQCMFAAFDAGLPIPSSDAEQLTPPLTLPHRGKVERELKRHHMVWWHWAAAAVIAVLVAMGGIRLAKRSVTPAEQSPIVAKETPKPAVDTVVENIDMKPTLAESRYKADQSAAPIVVAATKAVKEKHKAVALSNKQDSIEVVRTAGDLELAESEFLAEQQELERQLQELQQQRLARLSGWHYTSLPCE